MNFDLQPDQPRPVQCSSPPPTGRRRSGRMDWGTSRRPTASQLVDNPSKGNASGFISDSALGGKDGFDAETYKYAAVMNDAVNPVNRLDVVVSTQAAKDFLGARLSQLAERVAVEGLRFRYRIEVGE